MTPGVRRGDRGRHVAGQDRAHHRCAAPRALPVQACPADLHPEKEREEKAAGPAVLVGQTRRRSDPPASGGVLRAAVLRPVTRVPSRIVVATPHCRRWRIAGPGRPGSSKATSPTASDRSITTSCYPTLAENIHDNRFLRLLRNMLQAGYLEDWVWNATLSGAPQGGVASPILSNIYLDRLDKFVENSSHPGIHPRRPAGHPTLTTKKWKSSSRVRADAGTAQRFVRCASNGVACRARTPMIRGSGGYATYGTATTTSSGSPDRRPKPRKSRSVLRGSCVTNSSWNCRRRRP